VNRFVDQQPEDLAALDRAQAQGSEVVVGRAEELEGTGNRGRIGFGLEFRFFVDDQLVKKDPGQDSLDAEPGVFFTFNLKKIKELFFLLNGQKLTSPRTFLIFFKL
jgi:hypothetical protein